MTHAACQQMRGGIEDGHAMSHLQQTSCPLFRGDSASGYSSDSLYLTHAACQQMRGGIEDGHAMGHSQQTSCPLYYGSQASGYGMGWSTCTPLAQAELVLAASWLHPEAVGLEWLYLSEAWGQVEFQIERSEDGMEWYQIGEKGAFFPSADPVKYTDHELPKGNRWAYRIRLRGQPLLSNVAWVERRLYRSIQVYPNPLPAGQPLTVQVHPTPSEPWRVSIVDIYGRVVLTEGVLPERSIHQMFLSFLSSGLYIVQVEVGGELFSTKILFMP
ncbi:MAG: T9SS type A sorting domain-containing protein [Bacteroidia bacterium]